MIDTYNILHINIENIRGEELFNKLMERVKHEWENFLAGGPPEAGRPSKRKAGRRIRRKRRGVRNERKMFKV